MGVEKANCRSVSADHKPKKYNELSMTVWRSSLVFGILSESATVLSAATSAEPPGSPFPHDWAIFIAGVIFTALVGVAKSALKTAIKRASSFFYGVAVDTLARF